MNRLRLEFGKPHHLIIKRSKMELKNVQKPGYFAKYHGMDSVENEIIEAATGRKINNWVVTALFQGVEVTSKNWIQRMESFSIVSSLLVAMSFYLLITPTASVVHELEKEESIFEKIYFWTYVLSGSISILLYFTVIVISTLISAIFRVAPRDVDKWRIILNNKKLPGVVDACFAVANILLTLSMGLSLYTVYGFGVSIGFTFIIISIVAFGMLIFNKIKLQRNGHPKYSLRMRHSEEFDLTKPLEYISRLALTDRVNRVLDSGMSRNRGSSIVPSTDSSV